jgi:hypothetical protein
MYMFLVEDIVVVKEVALVIEEFAILAVVAIEILLLVVTYTVFPCLK